MKAVKANRCYTITEHEKKRFVTEGYDITDDAGNILEYGAGKTVPIAVYVEALKKIEDLEAQLAKKPQKAKEEPVLEETAEPEAEEPKKKGKK